MVALPAVLPLDFTQASMPKLSDNVEATAVILLYPSAVPLNATDKVLPMRGATSDAYVGAPTLFRLKPPTLSTVVAAPAPPALAPASASPRCHWLSTVIVACAGTAAVASTRLAKIGN